MKDIKLYQDPRYDNQDIYKQIENGVYKVVGKTNDMVDIGEGVMALSITLDDSPEEVEMRQYPLEDILDEYDLYMSQLIKDEPGDTELIVELAGEIDDLKRAKEIIGKRITIEEYEKDGELFARIILGD